MKEKTVVRRQYGKVEVKKHVAEMKEESVGRSLT